MRKLRWLVPVGALALLVPACSGGGDIEVRDAWARSPADDVAAVYFVVANDGDVADALVSATADVEGRVEVHETTMEGGQAEMQPVDLVEIPAGGEVSFEPGGYHVMLLDLAEPLAVGDTVSLVLTFEQAGEVEVDAEVREFVEGDMGGGEMGATGEDEGM
jgi:copper(I)-binding protein